MEQSKIESFIETNINIATGFVISLFVWQYIAAPLYGIQLSMSDNVGITVIFTVSAIIRGYFWRRFFAKGIHRKVTSFLNQKKERLS